MRLSSSVGGASVLSLLAWAGGGKVRQSLQQAAAAHHQYLGHPVGMVQGGLHDNAAGLGVADERGLVGVDGAHELRQEADSIGQPVVFRDIGQAEARLVVGHRPEPGAGQRAQMALEHVGGRAQRGAVQHDHRQPRPLFQITNIETVYRDVAFHMPALH